MMQVMQRFDAALAASVLTVNPVGAQRLRQRNDPPSDTGQACRIAVCGSAVQLYVRDWHDLIQKTLPIRIAAGGRADVIAVVADLFTRLDAGKSIAGQKVAQGRQVDV